MTWTGVICLGSKSILGSVLVFHYCSKRLKSINLKRGSVWIGSSLWRWRAVISGSMPMALEYTMVGSMMEEPVHPMSLTIPLEGPPSRLKPTRSHLKLLLPPSRTKLRTKLGMCGPLKMLTVYTLNRRSMLRRLWVAQVPISALATPSAPGCPSPGTLSLLYTPPVQVWCLHLSPCLDSHRSLISCLPRSTFHSSILWTITPACLWINLGTCESTDDSLSLKAIQNLGARVQGLGVLTHRHQGRLRQVPCGNMETREQNIL